jgi:hypothetical protein
MKKNLLLLSAFLLSAVGFAQNGITSVANMPAGGGQGDPITVSFDYKSDVDGTFQTQVFKTLANGNIDYTNGGTNIYKGSFSGPGQDFLPAAPSGGTMTFDLTVPAAQTLSVDLSPAGVVYKWFVKAVVSSVDLYAANPVFIVDVQGTFLGVKAQFQADSREMFINSASKSLIVNTASIKSDSAKIYNMSGKVVKTIANLKEFSSVDLSGLNKGVYVIQTNTFKAIKFAL